MLSGIICILFGTALAAIGFKTHIQIIGKPKYLLLGTIMLAAILWIFLPKWDKFEMSVVSFGDMRENHKILFYEEDAHGIVSVMDIFAPYNSRKILTTNRRFTQSSSNNLFGPGDHQRLGILPLLIHPKAENVLIIGLGAGITLRGANEFPDVKIDCVEISGSVVEAAGYFGKENNYVLDAENVNIIINDGRSVIRNTNKSYDVIIADIFFPATSGSSNVFSREYYEMCKKRLNSGGIMAQWLPMHQLSPKEFDIIVKTFASVFEHNQLWLGLIGSSVPVVGIIGSKEAIVIDGLRLSELYRDQDLRDVLSQIALDDKYMFLSHFIANVKDMPLSNNIPINTDDRPILEFLNPKMELNAPGYERAVKNMYHIFHLKIEKPQNGYYTNIDEKTMSEYNVEILNYIYNVFREFW